MTKKPSHSKKSKTASSEFRDWEPAAVPVAPDGGIASGFATQSPALPILSEETTKCLRGPCRNYWEMRVEADAGNPAGTWESIGVTKPIQIIRTCLANPGYETDLGDTVVIECNRWHPVAMTVVDVETDANYMRVRFAGDIRDHDPWAYGGGARIEVSEHPDVWTSVRPLRWVDGKILLVPRRVWDGHTFARVMLGMGEIMSKGSPV